MPFKDAWAKLSSVEGGFSNDPADAGGKTKYGITEEVARANGYTGRMEDLTPEFAAHIAKQQYWDTIRLDDVDRLSPAIAYELFDTGYNCGIGTSGKFLQRSLNALNREGGDYPDIKDDGVVGPITLSTFKKFLQLHVTQGESVMMKALNSLQGAYYIDISMAKPAKERFVFGWFANRVEI